MTKENHTDRKVPKPGDEPNEEGGEATRQPNAGEEQPPAGNLDLGAIGSQLRGLYRELLEEPIPDRFTELLKDLETKESGRK